MDIFLLDAARALHMFGLAVGLGLALCADVFALRSIFLPVSPRDLTILSWLHRVILVALALLWASGLYLLHVRTGWDWASFSPKLLTKLAVVGLLSLNALMIGNFALPCYAAYAGQRFGAIELPNWLRLSCIAGLSLSCWLSALALGVFSQLKTMPFADLQAVFAPIFLVGLSGAALIGLGAAVLRHAPTVDAVRVSNHAIRF